MERKNSNTFLGQGYFKAMPRQAKRQQHPRDERARHDRLTCEVFSSIVEAMHVGETSVPFPFGGAGYKDRKTWVALGYKVRQDGFDWRISWDG